MAASTIRGRPLVPGVIPGTGGSSMVVGQEPGGKGGLVGAGVGVSVGRIAVSSMCTGETVGPLVELVMLVMLLNKVGVEVGTAVWPICVGEAVTLVELVMLLNKVGARVGTVLWLGAAVTLVELVELVMLLNKLGAKVGTAL